ncbi:MAG: AmmeMemoRadiSam system protein B, partial [Methanobacteriota archaeon]
MKKRKKRKDGKQEPKKGFNPLLKTVLPILAITVIIVILFLSPLLFKVEKQLPVENRVEATKMETQETVGEEPTPNEMRIRRPAVAGTFYPSQAQQLISQLDKYLKQAKKKTFENIRGLVVPHAGYRYSGPVAASAYAQLAGKKYRTVIILGPSHHYPLRGASIPLATHYQTPLGLVKLSEKTEQLLKSKIIRSVEEAHLREHSIEVQLPFLQRILGEFELIPIVTGKVDPEQLAKTIQPYLDEQTLVVASSDLSHYLPYEKAVEKDKHCTEAIPNLDFEGMERCEACGKVPILTLMHLAKMGNWRGELLDYRNSGDTQGNKERVVGYTAIIFYEAGTVSQPEMLNREEQE